MRVRSWLDVLTAGFLPGALAGIHLAGLLFFLNPQVPFAPGPVLRGTLLYGALWGAGSLALHLPFTWERPRRARRWLPWALTLALAAAAALDWTHASRYAYFLPPGINERLIKTAIWLSVGALIAFYTALLHTLHRRRYGWRSSSALALLALLSVYAMVERREAFRPRPAAAPRPAAVEGGRRPRLWVVGLETATLDAILPLAGQGRLPFLAGVLGQGAYGRLESLKPPYREALWMTVATGKYPYKHGVKVGRSYRMDWLAPGSELVLLPSGLRFRSWGTPWSRTGRPRARREALALWEVLPRLGIPAGVVGWPASSPPSSESVFALTDRFFVRPAEAGGSHPADLAARALLLRPRPEAIEPALQAAFGPAPPPPVLDALAGDRWRQTVASVLLEQQPETEACFLTLSGLSEVSRRYFGGFEAVQFAGVKESAQEQAAERVAAYYAQFDRFLAESWRRQPGPKILAVVSAHGVAGRKGWRWRGGPRVEGSFKGAPDGVLVLYGEGIRSGALLTGARLVDLAPTLMYALGFPVARDLDGHVLTEAFDKGFLARTPLTFLPSYEALERAGDR